MNIVQFAESVMKVNLTDYQKKMLLSYSSANKFGRMTNEISSNSDDVRFVSMIANQYKNYNAKGE